MTEDSEQAALESLARVRPAVERLRYLLAQAREADSASTRTKRSGSNTPPGPRARGRRPAGR